MKRQSRAMLPAGCTVWKARPLEGAQRRGGAALEQDQESAVCTPRASNGAPPASHHGDHAGCLHPRPKGDDQCPQSRDASFPPSAPLL